MLKNKRMLKLIAVFAMLVMSMYMLTGCEIGKKNSDKEDNSSSYEEPIKNLIEGLSEANSDKLLKAFPGFISDYMKDIFTDEYLESTLKKAEEDFGANVKMSYKITDKTDLEDEELRKMEEDIQTNFNKEVKITKGYEVEIEVTTKGDETEDTEKDAFNVYEIDGKWYILDL